MVKEARVDGRIVAHDCDLNRGLRCAEGGSCDRGLAKKMLQGDLGAVCKEEQPGATLSALLRNSPCRRSGRV